MARFSYIELPVEATGPVKAFYEGAFGWKLMDYGPDYAGTETGDVDLGLNAVAGAEHRPRGVLPIVQVEDLEAALASVEASGGEITLPIFAFPGGRRFHFRDPAGNELGVFTVDPASIAT